MIEALEWVSRRRLAVLVSALLVAVVLEVFLRLDILDEGAWGWGALVSFLLPIGLLLGAVITWRSYRPARLVAEPEVPAFRTNVNPGLVLMVAGYTILMVRWLGGLVEDVIEGEDVWFSLIMLVLYPVAVTALWIGALGRFGVWLRPDGILEQQALGSRFVPWDALHLPHPARQIRQDRVTLYFARPEAVRRRGIRLGRRAELPAPGFEAELLARAIHEYANRPELRPAIGSAEELGRLHALRS